MTAVRQIFITITGPSGSGKSTLSHELTKSGICSALVSHTTRAIRQGEVDGKDYHFVSKEDFMIKEHLEDFLECVEFSGNKYGVSKEEVGKALALNRIPVLVVEPVGLRHISDFCDEKDIHHIAIYLDGSLGVLVQRLLNRDLLSKTVTPELVEYAARRIQHLVSIELEWYNEFGYTNYYPHYDSGNQEAVLNTTLSNISIIRKDWQRG